MESFNHSTDQTRTLTVSPEDTNQTRTVGMFMDRSDLDRIEMHPHLGLSSNPAKLDRCVRKVKAKGGARNAWAVCNASLK